MTDFFDISIPLRFDGPQPNAFGVERATAEACEVGSFVGDTRRGGSCNFEQVTLVPHCVGTHTECVGHITDERISVIDCLQDVIIPALLISVLPEPAESCVERYAVEFQTGDAILTMRALNRAIGGHSLLDGSALVIRTLPNTDEKLARIYGERMPPYFSTDAMEMIAAAGVKHLLVDLPSIDRLSDEGKLSNHRIFWNVEQGSRIADSGTRIHSTITELIYVPNEIEDGAYSLNLQIAPFASDASPSRPLLLNRV